MWREAQILALRPKGFAVLHYLVAHAGTLVTKQAILEAVWQETIVSDTVLKVCIAEIRQALGDTPKTPRVIATVSRRSYRFLAPVTTVGMPPDMPAVRHSPLPAGVDSALQQVAPAERRLPPVVGRAAE